MDWDTMLLSRETVDELLALGIMNHLHLDRLGLKFDTYSDIKIAVLWQSHLVTRKERIRILAKLNDRGHQDVLVDLALSI
jgi:hypothetical protein